MKLILKFNLALLLAFAIGLAATGYVSRRMLQQNAKQEVLENARIMMKRRWPCAPTRIPRSSRCLIRR